MSGFDQKWLTVHQVFPAGLDSETEPAQLRDGFTPDGWGMDLDADGKLAKTNTKPTGSAAVKQTYTIGANTWTQHYRRLWRIDGVNLLWGAPEYFDIIYTQGLGALGFDEDTNANIVFFPVGGNDMFVAKSTGGYIVPNAISQQSAAFVHGNIEEAMKVTVAANAVEINQRAIVSNANGLMSWDGGEVVELTKNVRNEVAAVFANTALTVDPAKRRVVGTSKFVYDAGTQKLFRYDQTGFRFTTRTVIDEEYRPFTVRGFALAYEFTDQNRGQISFQRKFETDWTKVVTVNIPYTEGNKQETEIFFEDPVPQTKQFSLRLTDLSTNLRVRRISLAIEASSFKESWSA